MNSASLPSLESSIRRLPRGLRSTPAAGEPIADAVEAAALPRRLGRVRRCRVCGFSEVSIDEVATEDGLLTLTECPHCSDRTTQRVVRTLRPIGCARETSVA